jgi:hypothetical protein
LEPEGASPTPRWSRRRERADVAAGLPHGESLTREMLEDLYVEQGRSIVEIARQEGCHPRDVVALLMLYGMPMRRRMPRRPPPLYRPDNPVT